jgi:D-serine deaminase-like pyridoxal phosphate-dependent protein
MGKVTPSVCEFTQCLAASERERLFLYEKTGEIGYQGPKPRVRRRSALSMTGSIGEAKHRLDTPVLLVDLAAMERNIAHMTAFFRDCGVSWRPHIKGIKVPAIAHQVLRAGAIGVTCAKLGEAEVMANAGIRDILIANEIVGEQKLARLVHLRRRADVIVCVDAIEPAEALSAAAAACGVVLRVLVEVNIGLNRCGVEPGPPTVALARKVAGLPGLRFAGVMGWEGHLASLSPSAEKEARCRSAVGTLVESAGACRAEGLGVEIVSCGGTGTYQYSARVPGVTEVQAGGGIFGDVTYAKWGVAHEQALTVLTTIISRPTPRRIVFDAGRKTMGRDVSLPEPKDLAGASPVRLSAEHGDLELDSPRDDLRVGDKLEFVVGYGDTTVCLHDELVGVRDGRVEAVWPIEGRGKLR